MFDALKVKLGTSVLTLLICKKKILSRCVLGYKSFTAFNWKILMWWWFEISSLQRKTPSKLTQHPCRSHRPTSLRLMFWNFLYMIKSNGGFIHTIRLDAKLSSKTLRVIWQETIQFVQQWYDNMQYNSSTLHYGSCTLSWINLYTMSSIPKYTFQYIYFRVSFFKIKKKNNLGLSRLIYQGITLLQKYHNILKISVQLLISLLPMWSLGLYK